MKKKIFIVLGIIGIIGIITIGGSRLFVSHIYNRTDCAQFNIDNIELRTGIDIPSILNSDCNSDGKIKKSTFIIDTNNVDITEYIKKNKFRKKDALYFNNGENKNTKWDATFNPRNAELRIKIEYKD